MSTLDYYPIKQKIESMTCPDCKKHPKMIIKERDDFEVECCCKPFKETIIKRGRELILEAARKHISGSFDKVFRR